ncbi:unnamed protein product [Lactuca virosa]|uniref:Uncharacterized protein n=1 Tax=Lactuca virosa TaxID=75947 RepID=A0AAU9ML80_9ASTR|nr:unnamed protein product [Lactuca virosa]
MDQVASLTRTLPDTCYVNKLHHIIQPKLRGSILWNPHLLRYNIMNFDAGIFNNIRRTWIINIFLLLYFWGFFNHFYLGIFI